MKDMNLYSVYKHTSPSGKVYIGITRRKLIDRWNNGNGYKRNTYFWNAIQKYGWNNFKHEVLYSNLLKDDACKLEIELIEKYKSNRRKYGYNISAGGEGRFGDTQSTETRQKISNAVKEQWKDAEIRQKHIKGAVGRIVSDETKEKIRQSNLGKVRSPEVGRKISASKKGKTPWNKGKKCKPRSQETKDKISNSSKGKVISEEQKQKISNKLKGRVVTPEWKKKISETLKKRNQKLKEEHIH